jgi:hypothetical protein
LAWTPRGGAHLRRSRHPHQLARLEHEPEPLPADVLGELDRILADTETDAERLAG